MPRIVPRNNPNRSKSPTVDLDLDAAWKLYDKQAQFVRNNAPLAMFLAGVAAGKTHAGAAWLARRALLNPGTVGALCTRTVPEARRVQLPALFDRFEEIQEQCGVNLIANQDKGLGSITLVNGTTILLVPYNRIAKVRSLTLSFAWVDECEFAEADPEEIWTVLTGRMRGHAPYPGIAFSTSPNGYRGITKKFVDAQRSYLDAHTRGDAAAMALWGRYHVTTATSLDNPYLPDHYFDTLRSMSKRRYMQEVEGKVLRPSHTVYQLEPRHMIEYNWRDHVHLPRVYGVDWGTMGGHAAIAAHVTPSGRWIVYDDLTVDDCPRGQFVDRLCRWIDSHGQAPPAVIGVDRACPVENQQLTHRYRHTYIAWCESRDQQKVMTGVEMVRDALDPAEGDPMITLSLALPQTFRGETAPLIPAMRGYTYHLDAAGVPTTRPRENTPYTHACDALRYAWQGSADRTDLHGGRSLWTPAAPPPGARGPGHSGQQAL